MPKSIDVQTFYRPEMHVPEMHRYIFGDREYVGQLNFWRRSEIEAFGRWLDLSESSRLLDIGSGLGGPARHLARVSGATVLGLELSATSVASATAALCGQPKVSFARADATTWNWQGQRFSSAIALDSIVHIDASSLFANVASALTSDARLLIATECIANDAPQEIIGRREREGQVKCITYRELVAALAGSGMRVKFHKRFRSRRRWFAQRALNWMDLTGHRAGRESMKAILDVCRYAGGEEVVVGAIRVR